MVRAISYIRYSTPKQALGDSLRRQLDRTRDYCAKHGLTLDESLRDEGLSGYKGRHVTHGALGRFLAAVEAGQVPRGTYLILEHLDRFSRQDTRIALTMLLDLVPGFNRSSQRLSALTAALRQTPRRVFASPGSCGVSY